MVRSPAGGFEYCVAALRHVRSDHRLVGSGGREHRVRARDKRAGSPVLEAFRKADTVSWPPGNYFALARPVIRRGILYIAGILWKLVRPPGELGRRDSVRPGGRNPLADGEKSSNASSMIRCAPMAVPWIP